MTVVENINGFVRTVQVEEPRLGNNTADVERVQAALGHSLEQGDSFRKDSQVYFPPHLVPDLARQLRQWGHCIKVVLFKDSRGWRVTAVINPENTLPVCGVAADLGTTRVVLRLVNLETGDNMGELGFDNPQIALGPDVLARIHYARDLEGLARMQALIIDGMNQHIKALVTAAGLGVESVYLFAGAGNTAMTHLFLGIEPSFIIREPYIPGVNAPESMATTCAGIDINPHGMVFLFPNIGSYFGGDLIAGILFAGLHKKENPCLMVDVGTNAEVVVGGRDWLMACAGAAGPALEGGISDMGMTAGPGVIDRVSIDIDSL
ncbi:MAG: ASKHA domain-containing protein, partial [Desulfobacterium sp.]